MADFTINFTSITQTTFTSPTCKVQIDFSIIGPKTGINAVQVYAVVAGSPGPGGLQYLKGTVPLSATSQYSSTVDLDAGVIYTIYLCPREETNGVPDELVEGEDWTTFCIYQPFATKVSTTTTAPQVEVLSVEPATLLHPNQITISWSGYSYTDGKVRWGPINTPQANAYDFKPGHSGLNPDYSGQFSATIPPKTSVQTYSFTVQVENDFTDPGVWLSTTVQVQSVENYHSLRQFLQANDVQFPAGVRQFLHGTNSLRSLMQI